MAPSREGAARAARALPALMGSVRRQEAAERSVVCARLASVYTADKATAVLTLKQRDCVVQYITEVCEDYQLSGQTAWIAMNYFDRYLATRGACALDRTHAELISLTCVLLASKFAERKSPGARGRTTACGVGRARSARGARRGVRVGPRVGCGPAPTPRGQAPHKRPDT